MYEDVPFSGPKYPNFSWTKSFLTNHYYYFHLPIGPFNWVKFKKNSYSGSRVMKMQSFLGPKWYICPKQIFLENYSYHFHLSISPFHWAKYLKNSSSGYFWAQNGPFPQMRIFSENLLMSLVSFIHAYLHAKNQSQILIYYWNIDD